MNVEIAPTKKVLVFGLDERPLEDLIWCASTFGITRLLWIDGYLLCVETFEKAFEHEISRREFPISQVCYTAFPKYEKCYEVEKGVNLPIVNMTGTKICTHLLKAILKEKSKDSKSPNCTD